MVYQRLITFLTESREHLARISLSFPPSSEYSLSWDFIRERDFLTVSYINHTKCPPDFRISLAD